jgi:hypothetical protein
MTKRFYGQDIRDKIIYILENGYTNKRGVAVPKLSTMLATIDTERSQSTPTVAKITYDWGENQRPLVLVDLEDDEMIQDELLLDDIDNVPDIYACNLHIAIKSNNTSSIHNYVETYIESLKRIMQGYQDSNITWILITGTERSDLYMEKNQTLKFAVVTVEIRIK